jgi:hypothetical protein
MGRAPCCDKASVKKGPWSPVEDAKLKAYIEEHGTGGNWIALPQKIGMYVCICSPGRSIVWRVFGCALLDPVISLVPSDPCAIAYLYGRTI